MSKQSKRRGGRRTRARLRPRERTGGPVFGLQAQDQFRRLMEAAVK